MNAVKATDALQSGRSIAWRECPACGRRFSVGPTRAEKRDQQFCSRPCVTSTLVHAVRRQFTPPTSIDPTKTAVVGECLVWTGVVNRKTGYGRAYKGLYAHRLAYTAAFGPIPEGLWVLHHCDNPPCVQTSPTPNYPNGHLYAGTPSDNARDRERRGRGRKSRRIACMS